MTNHGEAAAVRALTLAWVSRHLEAGERIVRTEALHGGITAEMRRLTIGTRDGSTRERPQPWRSGWMPMSPP
ncbi:hypothetical protein H4W31_005174 [Plantactinospora soyae]|uniref:Uncharacterized protein n=1 Tax=Plantactinospora soyae TaxID=1544732 RepID=A0A927MAD2_9ACTN|nr:hypothetical protein [Plantactinospora soyae]